MNPMLAVTDEVAAALPTARPWWPWRARSSATGCPTRRTSRWPARSRGSCVPAVRCRRRSRCWTASRGSASSPDDLELLASHPDVAKVSVRDLPTVIARARARRHHGGRHDAARVARRDPGLRHRRPRWRAPRRAADLRRQRRPHRAVDHAGGGRVRRREVDPRHRPHARDARDARRARARRRRRRVPGVLHPRQRVPRAAARRRGRRDRPHDARLVVARPHQRPRGRPPDPRGRRDPAPPRSTPSSPARSPTSTPAASPAATPRRTSSAASSSSPTAPAWSPTSPSCARTPGSAPRSRGPTPDCPDGRRQACSIVPPGSRSRWRLMTSRWIWLVPSKICITLASRMKRSTGKSLV